MASVKIVSVPPCIKVSGYQEVSTPVIVDYSLDAGELVALANGCVGSPKLVVYVGGPSAPQLVEAGTVDILTGIRRIPVVVTWKPSTSWMQGVKEITFFAKLRVPWRHEVDGRVVCDEKDIASDSVTTKVAYGVEDCGEGPGPSPGPGEKPNYKVQVISKECTPGFDVRVTKATAVSTETGWEPLVIHDVSGDFSKIPGIENYVGRVPRIDPETCQPSRYDTYTAIRGVVRVVGPSYTMQVGRSIRCPDGSVIYENPPYPSTFERRGLNVHVKEGEVKELVWKLYINGSVVATCKLKVRVYKEGSEPGPSPGCTDGQTQCFGYDLYKCVNGEWKLIERNSTQCGYTPGPQPGPGPSPGTGSKAGLGLLAAIGALYLLSKRGR